MSRIVPKGTFGLCILPKSIFSALSIGENHFPMVHLEPEICPIKESTPTVDHFEKSEFKYQIQCSEDFP